MQTSAAIEPHHAAERISPMDATLSALLRFYVFSTGRRLFALTEVQKLAVDSGHAALGAHCATAIAHDRDTLQKEALWANDKSASVHCAILSKPMLGMLRPAMFWAKLRPSYCMYCFPRASRP
jgi:hypothetical protein